MEPGGFGFTKALHTRTAHNQGVERARRLVSKGGIIPAVRVGILKWELEDMADQKAHELMQTAWALRRASLEAGPAEQRAGLTEAKQQLTIAVSRCRDQGPSVEYAQAIHLLANVELDLGHEEQARSLWEEAVGVLRGEDDVLQLAHKVRHLGDLHRHCGRLDEAEACLAEALGLYREHDSPGSLDYANAASRMADLRERQGKRIEALQLWRETRDLYAAVDLAAGVEQAEKHIERLT